MTLSGGLGEPFGFYSKDNGRPLWGFKLGWKGPVNLFFFFLILWLVREWITDWKVLVEAGRHPRKLSVGKK